MDTYGDMVTLLLTFFVLLYSFSSVDSAKWEKLTMAMGTGKGILTQEAEVSTNTKTTTATNNDPIDTTEKRNRNHQKTTENAAKTQNGNLQADIEKFSELYNNIKRYVKENGMDDQVIMSKTDNEILIRFTHNVLFDSGKATLKNEAYSILDEVAAAFREYSDSIKLIRIEGHTDNLRISTKEFPSNWELSTARAVAVLRMFIERDNISPDILSAVGYGEYRPIADNSTEEGRAYNRRVDFVIVRSSSN